MLNEFYCKYRLVIANTIMFFGLICIFIVPDTYWIHGDGFWQGLIAGILIADAFEIIKRVKQRKEAKKQLT